LEIEKGKKIFFISDFHLGAPNSKLSFEREKKIINWLNDIKNIAQEIYLMGDVFDFWFEYKTVVPKGYVRLLGKLAELADSGIPIYCFTGNHDMWMWDYFPKELGIPIIKEPQIKYFSGKKFLIGHGDGLGPGDNAYKFLKQFFKSKICQWLFKWIHPDIGIGIANYFSSKSRSANEIPDQTFLGEEKEWLIVYCKEYLKKDASIDYFIFGHRHLPLDIQLNEKSRYINLGEWIKSCTYAEFDGENVSLKKY